MTQADIVDLCYAGRGAEVDEIRRRSKDPEDDFSRLAHYIGRVGATRSSANTVVRAVIKVPALRKISCIRTVPAPEPREVAIDQEYMSPYEIVWVICQESTSQNPMQTQSALHAIVDLDFPLNSQIRTGLASRKRIITRVHAELQIADRFSRDQHMEFVDNDKYIGCSKPACYFCYNWLSNHKHRYIWPATHHKIIIGCRGPDRDINEAGATFLKEMYTKMCGRLDQDILEFLLNSQHGDVHLRHHYLSTEGSSRAPTEISTRPFTETS
jgi:OTT_1508-like deaminase